MHDKTVRTMTLDHGIDVASLEAARPLLNEGGEIIAMHVYEAPAGSVGSHRDEGVVKATFENAKTKMDARVKDLAIVTAVVVKGHIGRTIIDATAKKTAGYIGIGSHKLGLIDYLLGSTAARVNRHSRCAVHVLHNAP